MKVVKQTLGQRIRNFFSVTNTKFKITLLLLLLTYILIIFKISLMRFNTTDTIPPFKPMTTEALKKLGQFTVRIKTGLFIKSFPVFDAIKNSFMIDSVVWFEFNGDEVMLETIDKFSFDNGKIMSKSPPDIKVMNGKIFAKYNVLFELKTDLNFKKFPFEDHRLPIMLSNDFVTPEEMVFLVDASSFQVLPTVFPSGWKMSDLSVDAGFTPLMLDRQDPTKKSENPKAFFILNFAKASSRKVLIIFMPLFSAITLSLLSFIMSVSNVVGVFSLAITAVTALLGYRFVIEQMMPQVGYFTTADSLYLFLLMSAFLIFCMQLLITRQYSVLAADKETDNRDAMHRLELLSCWIFITMSLLLALATTYMILL